jgi:hypothetical protein
MGSPTHYLNLPGGVRSALREVSSGMLQDKSVAAFDTSLKMWWQLMFLAAEHRPLRRLRWPGGEAVARPEAFPIQPGDLPRNGEIRRARGRATSTLERMEAHNGHH